MKSVGIVLGAIVAGLAAYVIWGIVTGSGTAMAAGSSTAATLNRTSGASANDKKFIGVYGLTNYVGQDSKGRVITDKGTFFSPTTPNLELKEAKGFSIGKGVSGLFQNGHIGQR